MFASRPFDLNNPSAATADGTARATILKTTTIKG
jgi:hypothetical protein